MPRYLFVVSRHEPALFALLQERFAGDENVEVILDRREQLTSPAARPGVERRSRPEVNEEIRARAYAVVTLP
jgi:hypothetical protein